MSKANHESTILDAGLNVFHSRGFNASGVQDVVNAAGVPKGSFYNHFSSKEALGIAVLERYWELANGAMTILEDGAIPPLTRLDRHFEALGVPENGCLIGNFSAELGMLEAFRAPLLTKWKAWAAALSQCIAEGQSDGSCRTDAASSELAQNILYLWEGAVLMSRVERGAGPLIAARRNVQRLLRF